MSITEQMHGINISDPYRWLEDSSDPKVTKWISDQNERMSSALKDDQFSIFSGELAKNLKVVSFSNPLPVCGRYFYTERQPDQDQSVLYMKKGLNGTPVVLFDPNGKKDGNTVSIDYWSQSRSGKFIAFGISEGGDEMSTIYIKNTDTGEEFETIVHCRHSGIKWLPDDSGFYYTRNPRPGTVPKNEEHLHTKVYFHALGTDSDKDELIFGKDRGKDDMIGISLSPDGKLLGIGVSKKWAENDLYIYNTQSKETHPLVTGMLHEFGIWFLQDRVLLDTNYKANNYRVLWTTYDDIFKPIDEWKELIPEKKHLLESLSVTSSKLIIEYLVNACSEVFIFDYDGREIGKLPLPSFSNLAGVSSNRFEEEFFYGVDSFTFPKILYRFDPVTQGYSIYRKVNNPIRPEDYEVTQEWFASKDGTQVPAFIFHKKGVILDGTNPTILYGYGGFNSNETPSFMRNWVPWLERGGIFSVANIRGGGEFGASWHKEGIKEHKQNSFDDFIAAAEHLISRKYTSAEHLGILGGSNGGLMVSAVAVQRPELFKAVCARVPLTDMVRFPKFGIAMRWVHEYGDPEIKEDLIRILKWSPYHNVKKGKLYPSFLFTTANKDTRVDPLHARKMAAAVHDAHEGNTSFLYTEMEVGHGSGKPISKIVESQALVLSFFAKELEMSMKYFLR